jgi:hypothetical protein
MELMGRNETLSFTVGPENSSFNVSVLGASPLFGSDGSLLIDQKSTISGKISRLVKLMLM